MFIRTLLSLLLILTFSTSSVADKDWIPRKKDIYIALDDKFEPQLLKAELIRNWQKNNGPNTAENRLKAAEITRMQAELTTQYNFIFIQNDVKKSLYELINVTHFPSYKNSKRSSIWYQVPKKAFLVSTYPIRYIQAILTEDGGEAD